MEDLLTITTNLMKAMGLRKSVVVKNVTDEKVKKILEFHFKEYTEEIYNDLISDSTRYPSFDKEGYLTHMILFDDMTLTFIETKGDVTFKELADSILVNYRSVPCVMDFEEWLEVVENHRGDVNGK